MKLHSTHVYEQMNFGNIMYGLHGSTLQVFMTVLLQIYCRDYQGKNLFRNLACFGEVSRF